MRNSVTTCWPSSRGLSTSLPSRSQLRLWLPVFAWAALIFFLSTGEFSGENTGSLLIPFLSALFPHATPRQIRTAHMAVRKLAHFTEYLVLSLLLYRALRAGQRSRLAAACSAVAISGAYAISDELHQIIVPGRTAAAADCLIDVSGAAAGQGLLAAFDRG